MKKSILLLFALFYSLIALSQLHKKSTLDSLQGEWYQKDEHSIKIIFKKDSMKMIHDDVNIHLPFPNEFYKAYLTDTSFDFGHENNNMVNGWLLSLPVKGGDDFLKYIIVFKSANKFEFSYGHKHGGPFTFIRKK